MEQNRTIRHLLFWASWVFGFTFIKSFGRPFEVYLGWFSYYLLTLPIFIAHTYLVAYLLIPYFFNRRFMPVFIGLFLGLFYGFSVLELILSNEFIFKWYPTDTELLEDYLSPGGVIISGLAAFAAFNCQRDCLTAQSLMIRSSLRPPKQPPVTTRT